MKLKYLMITIAATGILTAGATQAKELKLSAAPPPGSPWGAVTTEFVKKVAEVSEGKLVVVPYLGGKLGSEQDVIKQIARGRIDIGVMSNTAVSLLVPEFGLLASPFAFDNTAQADCVADKHLLKTFGDDFAKAGVRGLSWMEVGYQVIFSKTPIRVPSDLKGMKFRTAPAATDTLYIKVAGGTAVPLSPSDGVPAMKTGQVEAATQLSVFGVATGYDKVGPQITLTRHQHQVGAVVISAQTWSSLSEQEKEWLNAAAPTFLKLRDAIRGAEGALLGKAKKDGATVIDLSDAELGQWRALAPKAQEMILDDLGAKARPRWDQINEAKLACAK